jgi:integrase
LKTRKGHGASKPFTLDKHQAGTSWDWTRKEMGFSDDPEFVLHALRHTIATRLIDKGIDLYTVKEWLGHSTIQVTERYAHLNPVKLAHAANVLKYNV